MNQYFKSTVVDLRKWITESPGTCFLFLRGPLGSGKTQLTKELLASLGGSADEVQSPTFLKMLEYDLPELGKVLHLDCYRMESPEDLALLGLDHYIDEVKLVVVEWPELFLEFARVSGLDRVWLGAGSQKTVELKAR